MDPHPVTFAVRITVSYVPASCPIFNTKTDIGVIDQYSEINQSDYNKGDIGKLPEDFIKQAESTSLFLFQKLEYQPKLQTPVAYTSQ